MSELDRTLHGFGFEQLLLALVFLASYTLTLSGLTSPAGRRRAGGAALLAAIAFTARTDPWVHGVLLIAFAVAGIGLFILLAGLLSLVLQPGRTTASRRQRHAAPQAPPAALPHPFRESHPGGHPGEG